MRLNEKACGWGGITNVSMGIQIEEKGVGGGVESYAYMSMLLRHRSKVN